MEWKRRPDIIWHTNTGLGKYWSLVEGKVNIKHCKEFVTSMRTRDELEPYPSGWVEGILVQFSSRYLYKFFGWDGLGVTGWSDQCKYPKPDIEARVGDLQLKQDGRYDVFALGNHMLDPWFSRMRGVLSQVFFQNNCNGILPEQLSLLLMADQGEVINWGLLVEEHFRIELRGHRNSDDYSSPIGPFLTTYIAHFLAYHRRYNRAPPMGSFLDVQREIAAAAATARDPALPGPSKRARSSEPTLAADTTIAWGPRATTFNTHSTALANCVAEMLKWIHTTEQERGAVMAEHKEIEERYKKKLTMAVQGARDQAQRILDSTHTEHRQQIEEKDQTLTNLRHQVTNLELELRATQDHVDELTKEKANAVERIQRLEQQSQEYLARCKTLAAHNDTLKQGQGTHGGEGGSRIQEEKAAVEEAMQNFEANKIGWIHTAAKLIANNAYNWLREHPAIEGEPPQEFWDHCIDNALATLELEQSETDWETMDLENMDVENYDLETMTSPHHGDLAPAPASPHGFQGESQPPSSPFPELTDRAEQVDIPEQLTDLEDTPQPSPRIQAIQVFPGQVNPSRPKPFKFHKEALRKIEEEYGLEEQTSDEEEAEEELATAVKEVQKYFLANPDLIALYSNPEANHVQCPACNKILGKTVHDVYQHAITSRSKHNLIHRGVGAAIAEIYGNQAPPRRQLQTPREETRPDRRPAHRRTRG